MIKEAHTAVVTRFQRLLHRWLEAEPSRNPRDLARAAKLSPSVIYALLKEPLRNRPTDNTFRALAAVPVATESALRYAVALDLELVPPEADVGDPATRALVRQLLQEDPTGQ